MINNTLFTGKILIREPEMLSTNDFGKILISKTNPIDGTVIITDAQTKGKGQGNNTWVTKPGENLTFSIIYNTSFLKASQQFYISMAIANGVYLALSEAIPNQVFKIKWPNDLICQQKKVGGILIENSIMGQYLKYSIVGIGINVNQSDFNGLHHASSLKKISQKEFDLNTVLNWLCEKIEQQFLILKQGKFNAILKMYNHNLYRKDENVAFKKEDALVHGIVKEVNDNGQLGLEAFNQIQYFNHGQLQWIWD